METPSLQAAGQIRRTTHVTHQNMDAAAVRTRSKQFQRMADGTEKKENIANIPASPLGDALCDTHHR